MPSSMTGNQWQVGRIMKPHIPDWARTIRENIGHEDQATLIIAKRGEVNYITVKPDAMDQYFAELARAKSKNKLITAGTVLLLLLTIFTLVFTTERSYQSLQARDLELAAQHDALRNIVTTLPLNQEAYNWPENFSAMLDELERHLEAQRSTVDFVAELARSVAPLELEARLDALSAASLDPNDLIERDRSPGRVGIGGAQSVDMHLLEYFFEDNVLDLLAKLNDIDAAIDTLPVMLPVTDGRISSRFGIRRHPVSQQIQAHKGIDIVATTEKRDVMATHSGVVEAVGFDTGFGKFIRIKDQNGIQTMYAHLSEIRVNTGDTVHTGMVIAEMGSTGLSTNTHLHYEIEHHGREIDPLRFTGLSNVR